MSTLVDLPIEPGTLPAGRFGGLVRAEGHRFLARRFIRVLLLLAVLGWVVAVVVSLLQFASPTPARLADARAQITSMVAEQNSYREQCLTDAHRPAGVSDEDFCGVPAQASDYRTEDFLDPQPFSLRRFGSNGAIGFGAAAAVLAFLLGATSVGAEWASRSIVALLFWEPRRGRVVGAKVLVVAAASALLGLAAQLAWLGMAELLQAVAGDGRSLPHGFWSELTGTAGRSVLLTVVAGLLGFGLTHLVRNTGAALGIGFVYFAVLETAVRALRPSWEESLVTSNAVGLVTPGGYRWTTYQDGVDARGHFTTQSVEHVLGNVQAGVYLAVVVAVVVGVGAVLFTRRDLQ